jgi:hypothetical protein
MNAEKMQRQVLPVGKSVASRVTHHRRGAGGTALLSERRYPAAVFGFNRANTTKYLSKTFLLITVYP